VRREKGDGGQEDGVSQEGHVVLNANKVVSTEEDRQEDEIEHEE